MVYYYAIKSIFKLLCCTMKHHLWTQRCAKSELNSVWKKLNGKNACYQNEAQTVWHVLHLKNRLFISCSFCRLGDWCFVPLESWVRFQGASSSINEWVIQLLHSGNKCTSSLNRLICATRMRWEGYSAEYLSVSYHRFQMMTINQLTVGIPEQNTALIQYLVQLCETIWLLRLCCAGSPQIWASS